MKKILVIEDDAYIRETITDLLDLEGFEWQVAENGHVGIELAKRFLPDLILSDVMMPEMDGHQVLAELKKNISTASIPFIFLSAMADKKDSLHGLELGAEGYITKPFSNKELLSAIRMRL